MPWMLIIGIVLVGAPIVLGICLSIYFLYAAVNDDDEAMVVAQGGLVSIVLGVVLIAAHYGLHLIS